MTSMNSHANGDGHNPSNHHDHEKPNKNEDLNQNDKTDNDADDEIDYFLFDSEEDDDHDDELLAALEDDDNFELVEHDDFDYFDDESDSEVGEHGEDMDDVGNGLGLEEEWEELLELERTLALEQSQSELMPTKQSQTSSFSPATRTTTPGGDEELPTLLSSRTELEKALLEGVVPADAGVGSQALPGDYGFDPLNLASKDYISSTQQFLLNLLPPPRDEDSDASEKDDKVEVAALRPPALILRDYREAEVRHGRLAMLAAVIWPLQQMIDVFFLGEDYHTTVIYRGGPTLPYLSLIMTLIMMLLGYLDVYAAAIKDEDAGDAFLPGECFWDPLKMLDGASDAQKRAMQLRELNAGRAAMVAILFYALEEAVFRKPLVMMDWNMVFFRPFFEIPGVQQWLDQLFEPKYDAYVDDGDLFGSEINVGDLDIESLGGNDAAVP